MLDLTVLGWTPAFEQEYTALGRPDWTPARVAFSARDRWRLLSAAGETWATVSGRLRRAAEAGGGLPAVGDWVTAEGHADGTWVIHAVLPRANALERQAAGSKKGGEGGVVREQAIAANLDAAFVVCGLDRDFNLRRVERYVTLALGCGVAPVVVLTKADLCSDPGGREAEVESVVPGTPVRAVCALEGDGLEWVRAHLAPGATGCFLGSSGAGKSTLINHLLGGERLRTGATSGVTGKGQHTTTHRELFVLEGGGVVIDNPGLREIGLAGEGEGVSGVFGEVEALGRECRFRDCTHQGEPGCAVRAAMEEGRLEADRVESFHKLAREQRYLDLSRDLGSAGAERSKWKAIKKSIRRM